MWLCNVFIGKRTYLRETLSSLFEFESVVHLLIYIQYEHGRAISANRCLMNSVVWNGHAMEVVQPLFFFHRVCCCCVLSHSV